MSKKVILTGLRANNDLHIGNYLGALMPMIDMAQTKSDEYQINLFVPDLHSFTTPIDHTKLYSQILDNIKVYVAAGLPLDSPNIYVYRQSYISAHSELTWILDCFTGFGEMSRMTQFKDKSNILQKETEESWTPRSSATVDLQWLTTRKTNRVSVGLFNYPVLMAADILLYGATYVPVGDDQSQHLEFTRDIAMRMNNQFGELFTVPVSVKEQHAFFGNDQGLRIKDLQDPQKKMSKSDDTGKGVIFLSDTPAEARKKIMSATTDSYGRIAYNYAEQPGISNLLDLLALFQGETIGTICKQYIGQSQYGPLKTAVADVVAVFLENFQKKLAAVDEAVILKKLETAESAMREQASDKLLQVQRAIGLRQK